MSVDGFQRNYGGFVWTNHALQQIKMRKLDQVDVAKVMREPDKTYPGNKDGTVKFIRELDGRKIHVIGKMMEEKKWLVLSAWVRGEEDPEPVLVRVIRWVWRLIGGK